MTSNAFVCKQNQCGFCCNLFRPVVGKSLCACFIDPAFLHLCSGNSCARQANSNWGTPADAALVLLVLIGRMKEATVRTGTMGQS